MQEDEWLGLPVKHVRFTNLENHGNVLQYGLNGVYLFGTEAEGDCDLSSQSLTKVPAKVYIQYQVRLLEPVGASVGACGSVRQQHEPPRTRHRHTARQCRQEATADSLRARGEGWVSRGRC